MKEKKIEPVDVTNDEMMVALGIRPKNLEPRDPLVWTKTTREKNRLKKVKNTMPTPPGGWSGPEKRSPFKSRLTVHIRYQKPKGVIFASKRNKWGVRFRNTLTHICAPEDVEYILDKYKTESSTVVKAYYNGRQIAV